MRRTATPLFETKLLIIVFAFFSFFAACPAKAAFQENPKAKLFLSPMTGSFLAGSTFEVAILLDSDGASINAVKADLKFPVDKLQVVKPSAGSSFISIWIDQPNYSNKEGTISFTGGIPDGIVTSSGVVSTIVFRVINPGEAIIEFQPSSSILANDGKGTNLLYKLIGARYNILPKPPEGPQVFSTTHPDENQWYNNTNPIVSWKKDEGVTDFSFILDSFPETVPDNIIESSFTTKAFQDLASGLWYFHIKALKGDAWSPPTHFLLRIDAIAPADFEPKIEFLTAALIGRAFVSFFTTDALSGLDHYEVAVIDRAEPPINSPVFIEAESPYQLPRFISGSIRVMVRALDKAGNVREKSADANFPQSFIDFIKKSFLIILLSIALLLLALYLLIHFIFGHKVFKRKGRGAPRQQNPPSEQLLVAQEQSQDQRQNL